MLMTLALTAALAQETPQLSDGFRRDPVAIDRYQQATRLAHAGQITTGAGLGVTMIGATILVMGALPAAIEERDPHGGEIGMMLGGGALVLVGGLASFVGPIMLYGYGGGASGALDGMGLDVDRTMLYAAWGLWGGSLALGITSLALPPGRGSTAVSAAQFAMSVSAFVLGSLHLGVNRDAAATAGISPRREPVRVAVAPWTDGHHAGALVAVGF